MGFFEGDFINCSDVRMCVFDCIVEACIVEACIVEACIVEACCNVADDNCAEVAGLVGALHFCPHLLYIFVKAILYNTLLYNTLIYLSKIMMAFY